MSSPWGQTGEAGHQEDCRAQCDFSLHTGKNLRAAARELGGVMPHGHSGRKRWENRHACAENSGTLAEDLRQIQESYRNFQQSGQVPSP